MSIEAKRICYVIPSLAVGGTERQLIHLIRGVSRDHDVDVICTRSEGPLAGEAHRLSSLRVLDTWGGWDFRIKRRIGHLFRQHRPDIVHSFMFGFDAGVNAAARAAGVPVVISSRRQMATWKGQRHLRLQRKANALVDCVVANCQAVAKFAMEQEGADPALFRVIHNGINGRNFQGDGDLKTIRRRYGIPFHTHVIGIVANFSPVKDHALFIDTAAELARRRTGMHFLMLGSGPLRGRLWRQIDRLGLSDRFTEVAEHAGIGDLYKLMSVSVLCSKAEGFPNAIMESMAAGTPVVAAAVGGIPELLDGGRLGKLVDSRQPAGFADAIECLLDHPSEREELAGSASKHVIENLSVEKMVDAYLQLYEEVLTKARNRGEGP